MHYPDIDIDFGDRSSVIKIIKSIPAMLDEGKKHKSGVHIQPIPTNPSTGFSALDHREADARGYYKLDLLNVKLYNGIRDAKHYDKLMNMEPLWHKLKERAFVKQLLHISGYNKLLMVMRPNSLPRLAMFLAIIRPGKKHLQYKSWKEVSETVWDNDNSKGYIFKKAHAVSYAQLVVLNMNLLHEADNVK